MRFVDALRKRFKPALGSPFVCIFAPNCFVSVRANDRNLDARSFLHRNFFDFRLSVGRLDRPV